MIFHINIEKLDGPRWGKIVNILKPVENRRDNQQKTRKSISLFLKPGFWNRWKEHDFEIGECMNMRIKTKLERGKEVVGGWLTGLSFAIGVQGESFFVAAAACKLLSFTASSSCKLLSSTFDRVKWKPNREREFVKMKTVSKTNF